MESNDKSIGVPPLPWPIKSSTRPTTPATPFLRLTRNQNRVTPKNGKRLIFGTTSPRSKMNESESTIPELILTYMFLSNFFFENKATTTKAICMNCNATLSAQKPRQSLLAPRNGAQQAQSSDHHRLSRFNQELVQENLVKMVVAHEYRFKMVEDQSFLNFMVIDKNNLEGECMNLYKQQKNSIIKQFNDHPGKIAIHIERWSCIYTFDFLKVSARYINSDWKLINRTIAFRLLPPPVDETVIVECIINALTDWKLLNKCGSITTESTPTNDLAVNKIKELLKERVDLGEDNFHIRCGATAIKEMVEETFKVNQETISKLRRLVHLVTESESTEQSFRAVADQCGLSSTNTTIPSRDFVLEWDSTHQMISNSLDFRLVFEHLNATQPEYIDCPTPQEWLQLSTLKDALSVFHEGENRVSFSRSQDNSTEFPPFFLLASTESPSSNRSFINMKKIERYLSKPEHYENNHSINIICPLADGFQKYWNTIREFSEIASVFDPRLKFQYLQFSLVKQHDPKLAEEKLNNSRNRLYMIFQTYLPIHPTLDGGIGGEMKTEEDQLPREPVKIDSEIDEFQRFLAGKTMIQTPYGSRTAELDLYLQEPTFSAKQKVLNDFHSNLDRDALEALMCTGDWLRSDFETTKNHFGRQAQKPMNTCQAPRLSYCFRLPLASPLRPLQLPHPTAGFLLRPRQIHRHAIHRSTINEASHSPFTRHFSSSSYSYQQQKEHPSSNSSSNQHHQWFKSFLLSPKALNLLLWVPVAIVIHEHGVGLVRISGKSPTFNPDSSCLKQDIVFVNKCLGNKSESLKRGDIITFWHPEFPGTLLTKRILGLEGDIIKRVKTEGINTGPGLVRVPMGHCWVEGDEPFHSKDSNSFGAIPLGLATAKVTWIVWPISRFGSPGQSRQDQSHRVRKMVPMTKA
ncbi:hypothetical protein PSHT_10151, partial [Puccinia striiformis]